MADSGAIEIQSHRQIELIEITAAISDFLRQNRCQSGILLVYTPHTTAGITINENADPAVRLDIEKYLGQLVPAQLPFRHGEGNSPAHIMSSLVSAAASLIIENGNPVLGTWQGVFFCEFDGPRSRKVYLKFIPG